MLLFVYFMRHVCLFHIPKLYADECKTAFIDKATTKKSGTYTERESGKDQYTLVNQPPIIEDWHGQSVPLTFLTSSSLVIDTNIVTAIWGVITGDPNLKYYRIINELARLYSKIGLGSFSIDRGNYAHFTPTWIPDQVVAEIYNTNRPDRFPSRIPQHSHRIPITVSRSSPEYQSILHELSTTNVGGSKGVADRHIIADLCFAEKIHPSIIPTFTTADTGLYAPLYRYTDEIHSISTNSSDNDLLHIILFFDRSFSNFIIKLTDSNGVTHKIRIVPIRTRHVMLYN